MDEISDLKQRIKELERQNKEYSSELSEYEKIFENSLDMICIADIHKSTFIRVNTAFTRILGYEKSEVIGKKFSDFLHDEDKSKTSAIVYEKLQLGENVINFVNRYRCKDGNYKVLSWTSHPNLEKDILIAIARDVTDIRRSEQKLIESERRLKVILENSQPIINMTDKDGVILLSEGKALVSLGLESGQLVGQSVFDIYEKYPNIIEGLKSAFSGKTYTDIIRINGNSFDIFYSPYRDYMGNIIGLVGMAVEITDQLAAMEALKKSEEKHKAYMQDAPFGVIIINNQGQIRNVNKSMLEMLGYTMDEITRLTVAELTPEEYVDQSRNAFMELRNTGKVHSERTLKHKDGRHVWIDLHAVVMKDDNAIGFCIDITESRKFKEKIRESEDRYRRLTENAEDLIWRADASGTVMFVNAVSEKLLGYRVEECVGLRAKDYMTEESILQINRLVEHNLSLDPPKLNYQAEVQYIHKNGNHIPFEINANVILNDQDQLSGYEGISRDISDRKKNEERIKKNERKFSSLFNSMVEGVAIHKIIYDAHGEAIDYEIIDVNPAYEKILGKSRENVIGKTATIVYQTESPPFFRQYLRVAETGQPYFLESHFEPMDKYFSINVFSPSKGEFATIFEDITERKKSEKEQQRLVALIENSSEFIGLADMDGNVIYVNEAGRKMVGLHSIEDVKKTKIFDYVNDAVKKHMMTEALPTAFKYGYAEGESSMINWETKNEIFISYTVFLIKSSKSAEPENIAFVASDITENKIAKEEKAKLELQLQQAQKMEAIGRLAGGIAHDFNNLLTGITGNISLAIMDLNPNDPLMETLEEIEEAAIRAADLTRQLLAFSRKQLIKPKVINLNELIGNMQKMLYRIIGEDVGQKFILSEDIGHVKADPGQVEQIIVNLAVNARDAMPDGGLMTIETKSITLDLEYCENHAHVNPGEYVMIALSDNGLGMDEETRSKIFDPFFTTKPKDKGTGLGLATVYGIVKQHDGHIECYSELEKGTVFKIYFPQVNELAEPIRHEKNNINLPRGKETILVVEDEKVVRNIAIKILEKLGYTIIYAEAGKHALDIVKEEKPNLDLMLTDVVMPGMNGRELANEMQSIYPELKIIYTSGYTENVIAHHGVIEEGLDFIGKPYVPKKLAIKIREVLDR